MQQVVLPELAPRGPGAGAQHQAAGDQVVIVTATNEFVTRPIAEAFGVSELIAVSWRDNRPRTAGSPAKSTACRRPARARSRVEQWLRARPGLGDVHITFYSDSINDLPCWRG
jgi:phosphoserine phosphatase